jgi:GAF domain-containing protein
MNLENQCQSLLTATLEQFGCQTGTIHRADPETNTLELIYQTGVPDPLLEKISVIPFGKGIAGAAAARRAPVTLCNLQQDLGGVARPEARQTGVSGSIAVPVFATDTADQVIGTLGIGMTGAHEFSAEEIRQLEGIAVRLAGIFENKAPTGD